MLAVGLWLPGLVLTCFGGGRLVILFEVEEEVLLLRGVEEEELDFEDLEVDVWLFIDVLTAITKHANFAANVSVDKAVVWRTRLTKSQ